MNDEHMMRTYTGAMIDILNPEPSDIRIKDIAHALAHTCRFCGHVPEFYSVAQHSIFVADLLVEMGWPDLAMAGLMHDAAEAYLHDLNRPLKMCLPQYYDLEERMLATISLAFNLPLKLPPIVKRADNIALSTEFRDLYAESPENCIAWSGESPSSKKIKPIHPEAAERAFLARFKKLSGRVAA